MDKDVEKLGRRSKEMEFVRAIERPRRGSNAPAFAHKRRRSIIVRSIAARWRSSAPRREAQTSRSPILEVCNF
jgi:hypothetical protein